MGGMKTGQTPGQGQQIQPWGQSRYQATQGPGGVQRWQQTGSGPRPAAMGALNNAMGNNQAQQGMNMAGLQAAQQRMGQQNPVRNFGPDNMPGGPPSPGFGFQGGGKQGMLSHMLRGGGAPGFGGGRQGTQAPAGWASRRNPVNPFERPQQQQGPTQQQRLEQQFGRAAQQQQEKMAVPDYRAIKQPAAQPSYREAIQNQMAQGMGQQGATGANFFGAQPAQPAPAPQQQGMNMGGYQAAQKRQAQRNKQMGASRNRRGWHRSRAR